MLFTGRKGPPCGVFPKKERNDLWGSHDERVFKTTLTLSTVNPFTLNPSNRHPAPFSVFVRRFRSLNEPFVRHGSAIRSKEFLSGLGSVASSKDSLAEMTWKIRVDKRHVALVNEPMKGFKIVWILSRIGPYPHRMALGKFS